MPVFGDRIHQKGQELVNTITNYSSLNYFRS